MSQLGSDTETGKFPAQQTPLEHATRLAAGPPPVAPPRGGGHDRPDRRPPSSRRGPGRAHGRAAPARRLPMAAAPQVLAIPDDVVYGTGWSRRFANWSAIFSFTLGMAGALHFLRRGAEVAMSDTVAPMINEELGAKVLSAAQASRALALEYATTGRWMPRERLPKLGKYHGGWPSFSSPAIGSDDGPRKLGGLFGLERNSLVPFAYDDAPELVELLRYVQEHPDIADLFQLRMPDGSLNERQDLQEIMTRIGAAGLATSVMGRADALGIEGDAELAQLYEEREAALLAPSLAAELVVPLTVVDIEFEERLPVSEHIWIERLQDKLADRPGPRR